MSPFAKAEKELEERYLDKFVHYTPIGKPEIYGRVDRIAVDNSKKQWVVIIFVDGKKYTEEIESFDTLIELI